MTNTYSLLNNETGEKVDLPLVQGTLGTAPASPATMFEDVFKDMPPHLRKQRQEAGF